METVSLLFVQFSGNQVRPRSRNHAIPSELLKISKTVAVLFQQLMLLLTSWVI